MGVTEPLERETELHQITDLLAAAASGRGQVCVIEGPSGVGKSRLLDECAARTDASGMRVLRARCSELTRDYPFGVVRNLFETSVIHADAAQRAQLLSGPAALAAPVFGFGEAADEFSVLHGLYWLTVNLAEYQPIVLLVDDLPWADDLSLRFLAYLAERVDDVAVAVVCTVRSGDPGVDLEAISHIWALATTPSMRPAELTDEAVETLLAFTLDHRIVDAALVQQVTAQTGGNPFLVLAVAEAMRVGDDPDLTTPESVRRSIARRLARLDPAARDLADAGSVLGEDALLRYGIRVAGLRPERGLAAAQELVDAHVLSSTQPVVFAHGIVRAAVYSLMSPTVRLAMHAAAAQLLSADGAAPEVIAEHLLLSGTTGPGWGLKALHDAGRAAMRKGAPAAGLRYLRHAADTVDPIALPARLLIDLGLAEAATGEPMSMTHFEQALDLIDEPEERAETLYALGQTLYRFGRFAEASVAFSRGAELFAHGDEQVRLRFLAAALSADTHLAPEQGEPITITGDGPGTRAILAIEALRLSLTLPPVHGPAALAIRALGDGALLAEQGAQGASTNFAILALLHCGRIVEANDAADCAVRDARERGAQLSHAEACVIRALVLHTRGRISEAAADAQSALESLHPAGHSHAQTALGLLIHCMIERGELDEAVRYLEILDAFPATPTPAINAYVALARGRFHLHNNNIQSAQDALDHAEEQCRDFSTDNPASIPWRSLAGLIAHAGGDTTRGHILIDEEIRLSRLYEVSIPLGVALQRRALTETGEQALATFTESIDTLVDTDAAVHLARSHAGLGRGLRRAGRRVSARENLKVGLDLAHSSGAIGLVAEIRAELSAAGGRPRRAAATGAEALTPTELRIARLAESGMSNNAIAEQTFVSRSTVAWHLRNIYRKLGIESREQLTLPPDL
jgi:DNA-binding CsgD family transcriptional regulator